MRDQAKTFAKKWRKHLLKMAKTFAKKLRKHLLKKWRKHLLKNGYIVTKQH
jgi:hypothetical protein